MKLKQALEIYEPVIGLEVHAQLKTKSKLFSSAPNAYDPERPNAFVTEYCWGLPGVLPVLNEKAVDRAIAAGLALDCEVHKKSVWDRKQYFYPDLPKGYQISQLHFPICTNGKLTVEREDETKFEVRIGRIHMEEDAGKSVHGEFGGKTGLDFNRAGVPLVEIVTEPDLRSAEDAADYLRLLRSILVTAHVTDGNMQEGSLRCDANVSIRKKGQEALGTRCEVKNLNSFRFLEQAIEFEIARQASELESGRAITQETRLFDPVRGHTQSMRSKEEEQDYRYFPDPDLPPVLLSEERIQTVREAQPELPPAKKERYQQDLGLPKEYAAAFVQDSEIANFFDACVALRPEDATPLSHLVKGEILRRWNEADPPLLQLPVRPEDLVELVQKQGADEISSSQVKKVLGALWGGETQLDELLKKEGSLISDPNVLGPIIDELIAANPKQAEQLRSGNEKLLGFFVGQVMKRTQGKAKPQLVNKLIKDRLASLD